MGPLAVTCFPWWYDPWKFTPNALFKKVSVSESSENKTSGVLDFVCYSQTLTWWYLFHNDHAIVALAVVVCQYFLSFRTLLGFQKNCKISSLLRVYGRGSILTEDNKSICEDLMFSVCCNCLKSSCWTVRCCCLCQNKVYTSKQGSTNPRITPLTIERFTALWSPTTVVLVLERWRKSQAKGLGKLRWASVYHVLSNHF